MVWLKVSHEVAMEMSIMEADSWPIGRGGSSLAILLQDHCQGPFLGLDTLDHGNEKSSLT